MNISGDLPRKNQSIQRARIFCNIAGPPFIHLQLDLSLAGTEEDGRGKAGNGLIVLGVDVGEDGVFALNFWRNQQTDSYPGPTGTCLH